MTFIQHASPLFLLPFAVVGVLALAAIEKIGRASTDTAEPDAPAAPLGTPQGRV